MDPYIRVLLVEQEPDTISVVSLCLCEIKECQLEICSSAEEALLKIPEFKSDLILFARGLVGRDSLEVVGEIHRKYPSVYLIISTPDSDPDLVYAFMVAGASDCVTKDKNYVPNLIGAVKKALVRIAERDSFDLPEMARAEQFAMDENLPDIVFSLDLEGKIQYVNRAVKTLLGYEPKDLIGARLEEFIDGEDNREKFEHYLERIDYEMTFRRVLPLRNSIGIEENFEINCTFMEGEMIYGVVRKEKIAEAFQEANAVEAVEEAPKTSEEEAIPARLGPYRVITLLGVGGMGRVYKGFDEQLDRSIAIKVLSKSLASDKEHLERFRREAKILASINHPNIALIYYFGNLGELPFFCLEYLPGGSIEDLLQKRGSLDPETAISYTMQVVLGLSEAQQKGVIHLDIKPSNLMITENDRIKVVDFGLAQSSRELEETSSNIVGTPLYLAPEQMHGGVLNHRCDIYSLGITFFQMLYGSVPFSGGTVREIFSNKLHGDFPAREHLNPSVPAELYEMIIRMTMREPAKRISEYSEIVRNLEQMRRSLHAGVAVELPRPAGTVVQMRGALYDHPFAEILGEIMQKGLSGKLTLSWIDLFKNIHFKAGKITAVLSSQEGESFVDLLLAKNQLSGKRARAIQSQTSDLFLKYSSVMSEISQEAREEFSADLKNLAWRILQGLFSWVTGEFLFEEGEFPGQINFEIQTSDVLLHGIKSWTGLASIRRKLFNGNCRVELRQDFQERLRDIDISPGDRFLLYRFQNSIRFRDLLALAGISEEEFYRLIYLFQCLGVMTIYQEQEESLAALKLKTRKKQEPAPALRAAEPPARESLKKVEPKPLPSEDLGFYYQWCAMQSFRNHNHWATVEYCKKALEHRQEPKIYQLMGDALATHPSFRHEAMDAYKKALELAPHDPQILRQIADLYYSAGSYALAKGRYEAAIALDPADNFSRNRIKEIEQQRKR